MKTLEQYLDDYRADGIIDFAFRATINQDGIVQLTIHPDGKYGDTVDYLVDGNSLSRLEESKDVVLKKKIKKVIE